MKIRIITLIFSTLISISVSSQSTEVEQDFKTKLQSFSGRNKTIQCDFTQSKKVKNIVKVIGSRGRFYYDNSGLMAMHYTEPDGDKVVMNDERFVITTSGKRISTDAKSNPMMAQISYMMQACMSGNVSKLGRGWKMSVEKMIGGYTVVLKPYDKRIQKFITSMKMCFRPSDLTLESLRIDESTGGYTEYVFVNKIINKKVDALFFRVE